MSWWVSLIGGAYAALCLTMWVTACVYAVKTYKSRTTQDTATLMLMLGIMLTFFGHASDQTLWTVSNIERALSNTTRPTLSAWYAVHIPLVVIAGKYLASAGAFLHLWVALHRSRSRRRTFVAYSLAWVVFALVVAVLIH